MSTPLNDVDIESRAAKMYSVWAKSRGRPVDWQSVEPTVADAWRALAELELEQEKE